MSAVKELTIPHRFKARDYQADVFREVGQNKRKKKRGVAVWHRRAGKEKTLLNFMIREMLCRVGTYFYIFPTLKQGRKILWDGIDREGFRFLDHFPDEIKSNINKTDMLIRLANGSVFQIVGTDHLDSVIGTNPIGCVFSEYSLQNPLAWDYIRPILSENDGWAIFNFTFRGKNHGYELYQMAKANPAWFCQLLTVDDTKRPDGTPVISAEAIDAERQAGMDEDLIRQEYYCDPSASDKGAYYSNQLKFLEERDRIRPVQYEHGFPVLTFWDIGRTDHNSIWFVQKINQEYRVFDFYQNHNQGIDHYIDYLHALPYENYIHWAPHDIRVKEYTSNQSRIEYARTKGVNFEVVPEISKADGIDAARRVMLNCWFDNSPGFRTSDGGERGVYYGLNALRSYRKEYDSKRKTYKDDAVHDWSSHASDAFRYLAVGVETNYQISNNHVIGM